MLSRTEFPPEPIETRIKECNICNISHKFFSQGTDLANSVPWHDLHLTRKTRFHHHQLIEAFKSPP